MPAQIKILLVDLNNFARYPTLSIGYLASILRNSGHTVNVFAPLMIGVRGVVRESKLHRLSLPIAKINYRLATSSKFFVRSGREWLASRRRSQINVKHDAVVRGFEAELLRSRPSAVMVSTYLMYKGICNEICALCAREKVPVIVGGPYFVQPDVLSEWIATPGLAAVVAGEV